MITMQTNPSAISTKAFITNSLIELRKVVTNTVVEIWAIVKKVASLAFTIICAVGFPGSFIAGAGMGLLIGVLTPSQLLKKSLNTISKVWEKQNVFAAYGTVVFMTLWGLPYTPYMISALRAAHGVISEVLSVSD